MSKSHVVHNGHLQIVDDLTEHNELMAQQLDVWPDSIIITPELLKKLQPDDIHNIIDRVMEDSPNAVCYLLPEGKATTTGRRCNGIRYGAEPYEYISLSQITLPVLRLPIGAKYEPSTS